MPEYFDVFVFVYEDRDGRWRARITLAGGRQIMVPAREALGAFSRLGIWLMVDEALSRDVEEPPTTAR